MYFLHASSTDKQVVTVECYLYKLHRIFHAKELVQRFIFKLGEVDGNFCGLSGKQGEVLGDQHLVPPHEHSLVVTVEASGVKTIINFDQILADSHLMHTW